MSNDPKPVGQTPTSPDRPTKTAPHAGPADVPEPKDVDKLPTLGSPEHPPELVREPSTTKQK